MQSMQTTLPIGILIKERYLVLDLLSKSSSGAVYLVEDQSVKNKNDTLFALKEVINPSKHKLYQIAVEGMSLRLLYHHALPQVYNVINMGKPDRVYILLDYIEGPNLEVLRLRQPEKRFSLPLVMAIMAPIMDAVTYLHSQRSPIIHQDIKPTNIIISRGELRKRTAKVVLVDFGIGKQYNLNSINGVNHRLLTSYEAPEQYSGKFTTRSDIYGLGATCYSLVTGIDPTDALSRESKSSGPLKPVNQLVPGVSTLVAACIDRAMSLNSNDRFPTVEQFHQALKADPAWQQAQKLNLRKVPELDLTLKGDSSLQQSSKCSAALSIEEQLPPAEGAASTSEDQQVLDIASSTLMGQQLLASYNVPSDTIQQATVPDVSPLIPIDLQVTVPDVEFSPPSQPRTDALEQKSSASQLLPLPLVDQPLPETEIALPDALDQQPLEPVHASFTLGDQQLSVGALNGMALLTPGSLSTPQTSHDDYSQLWPDVNIEMSFSQAGCEWAVKTQAPQNNNRKDLH
jgi:serine/threonine protein kinase